MVEGKTRSNKGGRMVQEQERPWLRKKIQTCCRKENKSRRTRKQRSNKGVKL